MNFKEWMLQYAKDHEEDDGQGNDCEHDDRSPSKALGQLVTGQDPAERAWRHAIQAMPGRLSVVVFMLQGCRRRRPPSIGISPVRTLIRPPGHQGQP